MLILTLMTRLYVFLRSALIDQQQIGLLRFQRGSVAKKSWMKYKKSSKPVARQLKEEVSAEIPIYVFLIVRRSCP